MEHSGFDEQVKELRAMIAMMERQHRDHMRPYYEHLCRYEAMRLPVRVIDIADIDPEFLAAMKVKNG